MKRINAILILLMLTMCSLSGATLSRVTVDGKQYYVYEVRKGDTMFGLARQFGWSQEKLSECNPTQMSTLQKGSLIYYPCDTETPYDSKSLDQDSHEVAESGNITDGVSYHKIRTGETLYGVSRDNNVSISAILEANPGVSEQNFRAGETIRIPASGTGLMIERKMVTENVMEGFKPYKVRKDDSWTSIAEDNNISVETLLEANKGVELKKNRYIGIPMLISRTVERDVVTEDDRDVSEIYAAVHGIQDGLTVPEVRLAVVSVEPSSRRDREILRGVLMAVNTLKNSGYKICLKMLDGTNGSERCVEGLQSFNPDLVISTAESNMPAWLGRYAGNSRVPVVNTLDVRNDEYQDNPYIVQLITPSEYFNEEIAEWFKDHYDGYSLVFTGEEDHNDQLAASLKNIWNPNLVRSRTVEDLKTKPLNSNGEYLLYSYPTGRQDVSEFLDAVVNATEKSPMARVAVIGRPNWIVYDESLTSKFHKSNVQIPARFYMNKEARQNSEFSIVYRQLFGGDVPNTFPVYSGIGYDAALYFIKGLGASGGDMNSIGNPDGMVQNGYTLERPNLWTGPVNREVYLVRFTPYDTIEKTAVR